MKHRVLLVEFVIVDRFHCAASFPYIQGWLKGEGSVEKVVLLRFGLKAATAMTDDEAGNATILPQKDAGNLARVIRKFLPSHVLFSHRPADTISRQAIGNNGSVRKAAYLGLKNKVTSFPLDEEVSIHEWFGVSPLKFVELFEFDSPDFHSFSGNREALEFRPLPHLHCGVECLYVKSVFKNPYFKELHPAAGMHEKGCTFCMRPDTHLEKSDPIIRLKNQLYHAAMTTRWGNHRPRYRILGEEILFRLEEFVDVVKTLNVNHSDFLFNCRADYIVKFKKKFERSLQALKDTGNKIQLCLIGIENFSQEELDRFNKGLRTETIIDMAGTLRKLEEKYPENFNFREYGGFSTILYTPWTTLADVEFNLSMVKHLGIENVCGKLLTSRLRLYPELPLTPLARRDGLLIDVYDDPVFDTAQRNFYAKEIPWRFKDNRVETFNKIAVRLQKDDSLSSDALYKFVRGWYENLQSEDKNPVSAALLVLDAIRQDAGKGDIHKILGATAKKIDSGQKNSIREADGHFPSEVSLTFSLLIKKGVKSVGRFEFVPLLKKEEVCANIKKTFGDAIHVECVYHLRTHFSRKECDIFYGFDKDKVLSAVQLTRTIQESFDRKEKEKAVGRVGVLLGYPECCARAYAKATPYQWKYNTWLHLKNRIYKQESVLPLANPYVNGILHRPCSLKCEETLRIARLLLDEQEVFLGKTFAAKFHQQCKNPVLSLLDQEGCYVIFEPETELREDEIVSYKSIKKIGNDRRLDFILNGDAMQVKKGCISVYYRNMKVYDFVLNAYVWWYKKVFHPEFWECCIRNEQAGAENTEKFSKKGCEEFFNETNYILNKISHLISIKTNYALKEVKAMEDAGVEIFIRNAHHDLKLIVEPAGKAKRPLMTGQNYDVSCSGCATAELQEKTTFLRFFLKTMDSVKNELKRQSMVSLTSS